VKRFADGAKALLLTEFLSAFWLAMKYFVLPKARGINEKGVIPPALALPRKGGGDQIGAT
jgi:hypothetical protein